MSRNSGRRARALGVAKLLVAAALLAWVASTLPWSDELVRRDGERELVASGEIEGVWRADRVRFRFDSEATLGPAWPPAARTAAQRDEPLAVERSPDDEDGWDWRPGMPRVFRGIGGGALGLALAMVVLGALFGSTRWWRLLNLAGCPSSWWNTLRLTYLGIFFNLVVPGLTGGDVVKAVFVVREHPERRPQALMTVVLDRMLGLWTLIGLATFAIVVWGSELALLRLPVLGAFALACVGMTFVLSSRVRAWFRVDRLVARLPMAEKIERLEETARVFQGRPGQLVAAMGLSLCNHLSIVGAMFALGHGFGDRLGYAAYIGVVSVGNVVSSIPVSPGGWGIGELAFRQLFELAGSAGALGVAVSVSYRLCTVVLGLAGGMFLLTSGAPAVHEAEEALQEAK